MSEALREILQRIQNLPDEDRLVLEEQQAQLTAFAPQRDESEPRYPLHGSVIRFESATEPVAEDDWEAAG